MTAKTPSSTTPAAHKWQCVADEQQAEQAFLALSEINLALQFVLPSYKESLRAPNPSAFCLGQGAAGIAVFFAYAQACGILVETSNIATQYLDIAIEAIGCSGMDTSLYSGFTGVGWAAQHLSLFYSELRNSDFSDIDLALRSLVNKYPWEGPYDLIGGLVGIGIYCLERTESPPAMQALESIVERLSELAEPSDGGIYWFTRPEFFSGSQREKFPYGHYNLGMAHGIPAVIAFLARVHAAGIAVDKSGKLIEQAVNWLLKQKLPAGRNSWFPAVVVQNQQSNDCKLGWCYGDGSIAAALLTAARATGQKLWENDALSIAKHAAARNPETSGVRDACFCHGSSGLAHIFMRLYHATYEEMFADASRQWLARTLEYRTPGSGAAGYAVWTADANGEIVFTGRLGIIEGIAGIGLALLAATGKVMPLWDRIFLLEIPGIGI